MKKFIFFSALILSFSVLILSMKKKDKEDEVIYSQQDIIAHSISANDLSRLKVHFTEVTEGKMVTQKAWLSVSK